VSARPVLPYLWMTFGAFSFAVMSTLISAVSPWCDWQFIAIGRTFLAMTFAAGLATASGAKLVFLRPPVIWMRSIAGSMALMSGFYSLTKLPIADVLTLTNMFPIWVAVLSWPLLRVKPRSEIWIAVAFAIAGVILIGKGESWSADTEDALTQGGADGHVWVIALFSSMFSAVALIGLHKLHRIDARSVVAHFSGVSLLFSIGACFVFPLSKPLVFGGMTLLMLLGVGVTGTVGQIFLTKAFAHGDPAKVSVVGLSQVVFGAVLELIFFGRDFHWTSIAGMTLVMIPSAWLLLRNASSTSRLPASSLPEASVPGPELPGPELPEPDL